jgi:hypothetical protein
MSRSILALARSVLDTFATRPQVVFPAMVICATEFLGVQFVRAQLPDLSGNETAERAADDRRCDRPESEKTRSDEENREKCDDRPYSQPFSPPAGIPPPMFGYSSSETFTQIPTVPAPEVQQPQNRATAPEVSMEPRSDQGNRSLESLLDSAPPALFAPPDSAISMGNSFPQTPVQSPSLTTTSPSVPLQVPTPPPSSSRENSPVVPAPPSLPSFVPAVSTPTSTRSVSPIDPPAKAIGCGFGDACAIPHPNQGVLSTDELVAALPTRFSFEENPDQGDASPELARVGEVARVPDAREFGAEALTPAQYQFQGVYLYQGDDASARARISGFYPLAPTVALGGSFDVTDGTAFADSQTQGASINELYLVASIPDLPNLRFSLGQLDLTSYFDRNSFAKDGATHFFNSVFQTNPALSRTGIGSRTSLLVNWSVTDNVEAKVAGFSSARRLEEFQVDGLAAELGIRQGNFIVRGTFATARDAGVDDGFREIFQVDRSHGGTGLLSDDREQAYGVNAELFVPEIGLGLFGRYGRYENIDADLGANTYSVGMNVLDLFVPRDRFGIAYGQDLSNDSLRRDNGDKLPDVLEAFYDFALLPNVRVGFSFQSLNEFSDSILGVRVKTEFDMTPLQRYP